MKKTKIIAIVFSMTVFIGVYLFVYHAITKDLATIDFLLGALSFLSLGLSEEDLEKYLTYMYNAVD